MSLPDVSPNLIAKLDQMQCNMAELDRELSDPEVAARPDTVRDLSIRRAALHGIVERYERYQAAVAELDDLHEILADDVDPEMAQLAKDEIRSLQQKASELISDIQKELVTADDRVVGSVILELRAGVGGDEAALWAGDLLEMYGRFAALRGWTCETLDLSPGEVGGLKSAIVNIRGKGVWAELGYEGGTHCVKRVPATEAQGRIHTSTATVAALPEPTGIDVQLNEADVQVHIGTAQGPGGQNVNKVATAVHLIHVPTGIEVRMQESKSQRQNRDRAWQLLRARLYERECRQQQAQRQQARVAMIGRGERSERIRTYRYKEGIVVDHRLTGRNFPLQSVLNGELTALLTALAEYDIAERLAAL
ncbi:MAG: PCRF domain-containing protein [Phycisphaerales bacterium]|nr:PCRF domain-containing protein [Phycisphaerales bacterium]